ncbi:VOC family protein [Sphingobium fluviale]|uniref:VOC family protein n=1 Tax=Sphingobium fluviale TaxID=2506423 RepID=A0A4Q1KHF4_9SPHN|nr:VOC family protein [Sphingobium fluviale]RXR29168.1 VOC family protein [Sphingobium fluviale]
MANKHGDFIWYELMTREADAAQSFYGSLLEWTFAGSDTPGMDYRIINAPAHSVGGVMQLTPQMIEGGAFPAWVGYVAVDDVDKCAESIAHGGGNILMPGMDIAEVGRIAMVTDPQGAPFYIMAPSGNGESLAFAHDRPRIGHCAWNELITSDQGAALHFYGARFGWVKDGAMDMGPMGSYDFIRHGAMIGAIMTGTDQMGPPHWNHYFRVADIDAAVAAIDSGGGKVLNGPMEIPGGDFALQGIDPQGAHFALVGPRH